jgi:hypothetical protein
MGHEVVYDYWNRGLFSGELLNQCFGFRLVLVQLGQCLFQTLYRGSEL